MAPIAISCPSNGTAIGDTADWRAAVSNLIDHWAANGRCYSSGEVTAALRTHRPDLRFSVWSVGAYLRDLFYAGTMPAFIEVGGHAWPYLQVSRLTEGKYPNRTPADHLVFVYCCNADDGYNHDFEIFVPKPGETMADDPGPQPTQPRSPKETVDILGAQCGNSTIRARVHDDKRMCIPRKAFELFVHFNGQPMRGGDPVFVTVSEDAIKVNRDDSNPAARPYDLSKTRGRILFPSPDPAKPFKPGATYKIRVDANSLTVDWPD